MNTTRTESAPPATRQAPASPPPQPGRPANRRLGVVAPPLVLGLVLLAGWQIVRSTGLVAAFFLPGPATVVRALVDQIEHGSLLDYTRQTLVESLAGSGLGIGVALPLGYLIARSRWAALALQPYVAASQAVPAVALAPLLALWIGYGLLPIAILCAVLVFFPILVNTVLGLRSLDPDVLNAARVDGVGHWEMFRYIEFPLALPAVLTGVRAGLTLSVTGAVVGEFVMGGEGLGQLLAVQRSQADTVGMFATLLMLTALAVAIYGLLSLLERSLRI